MGAQAHRATRSAKPGEVAASWHVIDATDVVLGRMATKIADLLCGKHHALFTPHVDTGDFVIVINAEKVKLTGRKREQKTYYRHSGYTGNLKSRTAEEILSGPYDFQFSQVSTPWAFAPRGDDRGPRIPSTS